MDGTSVVRTTIVQIRATGVAAIKMVITISYSGAPVGYWTRVASDTYSAVFKRPRLCFAARDYEEEPTSIIPGIVRIAVEDSVLGRMRPKRNQEENYSRESNMTIHTSPHLVQDLHNGN